MFLCFFLSWSLTYLNSQSVFIFYQGVMPAAAKKVGKNKKSGKKSAKKGLKGLQSIAEVLKSVRHQYELKSSEFNSYVHPDVKKLINQYAENNTLLAKVSMVNESLLQTQYDIPKDEEIRDMYSSTPSDMQLLQHSLQDFKQARRYPDILKNPLTLSLVLFAGSLEDAIVIWLVFDMEKLNV